MKREIKFRGLHCDDNIWVYGDLKSHSPYYVFIGKDFEFNACKPETVGQFTGFEDMDGKDIYEGDIIAVVRVDGKDYTGFEYEVSFEKGSFIAIHNSYEKMKGKRWGLLSSFEDFNWDIRVIGNIHNTNNYEQTKKQNN